MVHEPKIKIQLRLTIIVAVPRGNNMLPYSLESERTSKKFVKLMKLG